MFQGLTKWVRDDDGVLVTEPDIAATWESADAQTWVFHLKQGVTFQAPVSRAGDGAGLRRLVDARHRPREPVLRGVHPGAGRGLRRPRLPDRPVAGAHGRDGHRRPDAAGHPALPLRRLPGDARASGRRGDAGRVHRPGRRQGVRQEPGGHRAVQRAVVAARQGDPPRQEHVLLGRRAARRGSTPSTCPSTRTSWTCGRTSRRASSTAPRSRPTRSPPSRRARRSPTAPGRPAPGPRPPSTSSAST